MRDIQSAKQREEKMNAAAPRPTGKPAIANRRSLRRHGSNAFRSKKNCFPFSRKQACVQ
jgi:hypothetical protein